MSASHHVVSKRGSELERHIGQSDPMVSMMSPEMTKDCAGRSQLPGVHDELLRCGWTFADPIHAAMCRMMSPSLMAMICPVWLVSMACLVSMLAREPMSVSAPSRLGRCSNGSHASAAVYWPGL